MGSIRREQFDVLPDGRPVDAFILENDSGMRAKILTFGGSLNELWVPDRNGESRDIICGFDTIRPYAEGAGYQGALIGRFANRINKGRFTLDGKEYQMSINDMNGHLHGGFNGFTFKIWDAEPSVNEETGDLCLALSIFSPDGEENYPGNLQAKVIYTLTNKNELRLDYYAETDKRTIINMTNHAYFNLDGYDAGDILSHELNINADHYNMINEECIPTGEIAPVEGTPFDFRVPKKIGRDIEIPNHQMDLAGGYDHNMVFCNEGRYEKVAELYSAASGRCLSLYSDQPGMQLYAANHMAGDAFKHGVPCVARHAVCLETQSMPDSPNHPNFTNVILDPGETFHRTTAFVFSVR